MKKMTVFLIFCFLITASLCIAQEDAKEIIQKCYNAHGGKAMTEWNSMVIKGEVLYTDIGKVRGAYVLYAQKPDKIRWEIDLTKLMRGRMFMMYFYNDGQGWMIRNLRRQSSPAMARMYKAKLEKLDGISYYLDKKAELIKKEDTENAFIIQAVMGKDTTELHIDKNNFYLVKEKRGSLTLDFSEFKKFGDKVIAMKVDEKRQTAYGLMENNYTYKTIEFNVPIESVLFEFDRPPKKEK